MQGCIFNEADLSSADLSGCNLSRTTFCGAKLTRSNLSGVVGFESRHLRLLHPDLQGINLAGLDLSNCVAPVKADMANADFSNCTMQCAQLTGSYFSVPIFLPRSHNSASTAGARLSGSNFTASDLTNAALPSEPSMTEGCILRSAVLRYCHVPVQVIESFHPDLYGVTFSGLNLKAANFARLDISNSKFDKCILDHSDFTECTAGDQQAPYFCRQPNAGIPPNCQFPAVSNRQVSLAAGLITPICPIATFLRASWQDRTWAGRALQVPQFLLPK